MPTIFVDVTRGTDGRIRIRNGDITYTFGDGGIIEDTANLGLTTRQYVVAGLNRDDIIFSPKPLKPGDDVIRACCQRLITVSPALDNIPQLSMAVTYGS